MSNCDSCKSKDGCSKDKSGCMIELNPSSNVKKIIGVMSGKGGVGKSSISVLLAKQLHKLGYKVGVLDADITGPSIPRLLGLKNQKVFSTEENIIPAETEDGIKVMSLNLLTENEEDPVIWRGPMIAGVVKQFWTDVLWGDLDYLVIDMPPGTGDVALTAMQSIPIDGVVMVSVPQDLVSMIVSKAINMARKMDINVLGVVENMSYIVCPDCDKKIRLFNSEGTEKFLKEMNLDLLAELPMMDAVSNLAYRAGKEESDKVDEALNNIINPMTEKVISELNK